MQPPTPEFSYGPPRGMRDFYPEDMVVRNAIFDAWARAARRFGFAQYDACVVENLDLLRRKGGEEIVEQIYAFKDKSDRELALRAEMTPTLARMIVARQGQLAFPLKWFTIAQCFRYERTSKGRKREHYQWNLDCIGEDSVLAEAEVIAAAVHALSLMGLGPGDFFVHVNSRALLSDLFLKLGIAREHHAATFLALDKRGKIEENETARLLAQEGVGAEAVGAIFKLLAVTSMAEALPVLGEETAAYRRLAELLALCAKCGIADRVKFDISVVRGLGYYTGIVFEAFDAGRQFRAIFGGGRYDNLLSDLGGRPASAVGLGFGDVVVAELLANQGKLKAAPPHVEVAIGYMEASQRDAALFLARALRDGGQDVDLALHPEKARAFFSRVGNSSVAKAVYIGPDDVQRGTARMKDLLSRTDAEIPIPVVSQPSPDCPSHET